MTTEEVTQLLAPCTPEVREVALRLRTLVSDVVPDATEELDHPARLIAYTFIPGTYKGLFVAIALHQSHADLMFSKGVELQEQDPSGLLEGTGKKARHIRFRGVEGLDDPQIRTLVAAAADRTPRT